MMSLLKPSAFLFLALFVVNCATSGDSDNKESNESHISDSDKAAMNGEADDSLSDEPEMADQDSDSGSLDIAEEELSDGDSSNESAEAAPEPAPAEEPNRSEASAPFKDGMYTFSTDCTMREDPEDSSPSAGTVNSGKKLWVEGYDNNWVKVFKKSGPVFVNKNCL